MKKRINHPNSIWLLALFSLGINFLVIFSASQILASEEKNNQNSSNLNSNNSKDVTNNSNSNNSEKSEENSTPIIEMKPEFNFDLANGTVIEGTKNIQGKVEGAFVVEFYLLKKGSISPEYYLGKANNSDSDIEKWSVEFSSKQFPNGDYEIFAKIKNIYGYYKSGNKEISIKNSNNKSVKNVGNSSSNSNNNSSSNSSNNSLSNNNNNSSNNSSSNSSSNSNNNSSNNSSSNSSSNSNNNSSNNSSSNSSSNSNNNSSSKSSQSNSSSTSEVIYSPTPNLKNETIDQISPNETSQIKSELAEVYEKEAEIKSDSTLSLEEKTKQLVEIQKEKEEIKKRFISRQEAERVLVKNPLQLTFEEKEKIARIKEQFKEDSDGDGLPDFEEERIGTDILSADTDGDGYLDGDEVKNGFNPLEIGSQNKSDKIIFEEPKEKGEISPVYEVKEVSFEKKKEITEDGMEVEKEGIKLQGKALPSSFVTLYIYSSAPIVVTVQADEDGNWKYLLDKELEDGEHQVYATVTDNTGKITAKSEAFSFVKTAKAVEKVDSRVKANELMKKNASPIETMQVKIAKFILIFSFISFFLAIGSIALFVRHREFFKKKIEEMKNNE